MLVVIAIIAVLIGLLLPAVQKFRDAASRALEWPELSKSSKIVLSNADTMAANQMRAIELFDDFRDVMTQPKTVAEIKALLAQDMENRIWAYNELPVLDPNADPECVRAYEALHAALTDAIVKYYYTDAYLANLLRMLIPPA